MTLRDDAYAIIDNCVEKWSDPASVAVDDLIEAGLLVPSGAERIIRLLAATDPVVERGDYHWCAVSQCRLPLDPKDHDDDCPWRLAVEWVEANS